MLEVNYDTYLESGRIIHDPMEKPVIYLCNCCEGEIYEGNKFFEIDKKKYCEDCVAEENQKIRSFVMSVGRNMDKTLEELEHRYFMLQMQDTRTSEYKYANELREKIKRVKENKENVKI